MCFHFRKGGGDSHFFGLEVIQKCSHNSLLYRSLLISGRDRVVPLYTEVSSLRVGIEGFHCIHSVIISGWNRECSVCGCLDKDSTRLVTLRVVSTN